MAQCIDRLRLDSRLDAGHHVSLVLVSAPAGFGKTTLLARWAGGGNKSVAWLSLDAEDNDPRTFWACVLAAIQRVHPDLGRSCRDMLESPFGIPPKAIVKALINDLEEKKKSVWMVIDDFHRIEDDETLKLFRFFLDYMPGWMHLVIATRTDLPFPVSRLKIEDRFARINAEDLRFTPKEAELMARQVVGRSFAGEQVFELARQCEGWAAGLQIAMLAARRHKSDSDLEFPQIQAHIIDYFMDEVICYQSPDIQEFLLETSVLNHLNPLLCDAVARRNDSESILKQLCVENLFLVPLDQVSFWYRYHQMFAEALHARLAREHPHRIEKVHRRAADWFYDNNMPGEAVYHAAAAHDWDFASWLVSKYAAGAILRGDSAVVLRWIRYLPREMVSQNPFLCISYAWALFLTNLSKFNSMPFHAIEHLLQEAEKNELLLVEKYGHDSPATGILRANIDALRLHLAYSRNEPRQKVIDLGKKTLEKFPEDNLLIRTNTLFTMALSYLDTGDLENCSRCLDQSRSAAFMGGFSFQVILSDSFRIFLARLRGRLRAAQIMCRDGLESVRQSFVDTRRLSDSMLGYYEIHQAYFLYEANRLAEAEAALEKGMKAVNILGETYGLLLAYPLMFFIRLHGGADEDDLLAPLSEIEKLSVYCCQARPLAGSLRILYRVCRFQDNALMLRQAFGTAQQYDLQLSSMPKTDSPYPVPFEKNMGIKSRLNLLRLYLAAARLPEKNLPCVPLSTVAEHIENLMEDARCQDFGELETEAMMLLALAHHARSDKASAFLYLKEALHRGHSQGYLRMFINEGKALVPLLEDIAAEGVCVEYASQLLQHMIPGLNTDSSSAPDLMRGNPEKPLSRQEQAVLGLIARGLSNQQIAEELCIAVPTVKTHNYNIFKKLSVSSRTAATDKAKRLRLL